MVQLQPQSVFGFGQLLLGLLTCMIAVHGSAAAPVEPVWNVTDSARFIAWRAEIGSDAGSPVLADGRILIGTNNMVPRDPLVSGDRGVMMAFSRKGGQFLWQQTHARLPHRANDLPTLGLLGQPVLDGKRVFYQTNRGELVCYEEAAEKGREPKLIWKLDFVADLGIFKRDAGDISNPLPSPLLVGDLVYCVTGNGSDFGYVGEFGDRPFVPKPNAPSFVAVDKRTGKVQWKSDAPGKAIAYAQWGSPVAAEIEGKTRVFFPGGDGVLYAFDAIDGKLLGKVDCNIHGQKTWGPGRGTRTFFLSQPVVRENMAYIGLNQDLETPKDVPCPIVAVDLTRLCAGGPDALKWSFTNAAFDGVLGRVAVSDGQIFAMSRSGLLVSLNRGTGREEWSRQLDGCARFGGPVIHGDRLYAPASDAIHVFRLDREPVLIGKYEFEHPLMGCPIIDGDHLFVATSRYLWNIRRQD